MSTTTDNSTTAYADLPMPAGVHWLSDWEDMQR